METNRLGAPSRCFATISVIADTHRSRDAQLAEVEFQHRNVVGARPARERRFDPDSLWQTVRRIARHDDTSSCVLVGNKADGSIRR
ncbi:hypothetical protein Zmor_009609 [Zophobas morio]|uniref:Uncharacterized protein n=1 Tax=Zophobas morio TaxID=2755281 RepID=A0AA38MI62_9CUCU|nr:hypothetical protein Zmor_009609 [Zophobas morio]